MKIDLSKIDLESFNKKECIVGGFTCFLITPKEISVKFTQENKIFRSSLWDEYGNLISASYPKFKNAGEDEENFPMPKDIRNTQGITKIDGSTLCLSKWKNNTIIRTRGCIDPVNFLDNGKEIDLLKEKYPKLFNFGGFLGETLDYTIITEWVSPQNQIVIKYSEPDLYLTGIISHDKYELATQEYLDFFAKQYNLKRPEYHNFNSLNDLLEKVKGWPANIEGVCLYHNNGQSINKIKSILYLKLHAFKSNATLKNVLDLFFDYDCPDYLSFENKLIKDFDYECFQYAKEHCRQISDQYLHTLRDIYDLKCFVKENKNLPRKDFAQKTLTEQKENSSFIFELLDKKELSKKSLRKLMERELKL